MSRRAGARRASVPALLWLVVLVSGACRQPLQDLEAIDGAITVRNQTDSGWRNLRIFVNEYYYGEAREVPAGGFLREPVSRFVDSYSRGFPVDRLVTSVVVLATNARGEHVRLAWGKPVLH